MVSAADTMWAYTTETTAAYLELLTCIKLHMVSTLKFALEGYLWGGGGGEKGGYSLHISKRAKINFVFP